MTLPAEFATRCSVVNSRIVLSEAKIVDGKPDEYVFRFCSNLDNCYHRADFIGAIPECRLHVPMRKTGEPSGNSCS